jgi:hypothetical protein
LSALKELKEMARLSWRSLLAATATGVILLPPARAVSFGNQDEPPQDAINGRGNPASATDPGAANPSLVKRRDDPVPASLMLKPSTVRAGP